MKTSANDFILGFLIQDDRPSFLLLIILTCAMVFIIQTFVKVISNVGKKIKSKVLHSSLVQGKNPEQKLIIRKSNG